MEGKKGKKERKKKGKRKSKLFSHGTFPIPKTNEKEMKNPTTHISTLAIYTSPRKNKETEQRKYKQ